MSIVRTNVIDGIPIDCRQGNNKVAIKGLIFTSYGFQFSTKANAGDVDNWTSGIIAKTVFPVNGAKEIEDMSGDDLRYESPYQEKIELFEGKVGFKISYHMTEDQHKVLRTYAGKKLRVFLYDFNNNIWGTSPDGTIVRGFATGFLDVPKRGIPTADKAYFSSMEIQFEHTSEMEDSGITIMPYLGTLGNIWYPYNLTSLTKVTATQVGIISGNSVTFDLAYKSLSDTDNDGNPVTIAPITGLDVATFTNFTFTDGSAAVVPTTMTESSTIPGRYTANFTAFTAGDVTIVPTVSNLYESELTTFS